ncbi:MAG: serine/threonine protein kinase [Deltaproteobacteria bacterium]|nr:serine/threonine protein kinase [Deltaproteobacteria bacterium]
MAEEAFGPEEGDEEDPLVGRVLGEGYVLEKRLGGGGFGAVYAATDPKTGEKVAAKVLRVDRAALSADARTRFRREAQALVSLRHPRIVAIHAHGTSDEGLEYLVMDLLEGEDLADHLHRRRRIPVPDALALFDGMAEAVEYAHEQGFAHRDLKPANVFLRTNDEGGVDPIVLDFGLAKMVEGSEESLTATGMVLGTPQYMAPEQATGEKVDRRADVYALGCILYEMLTGEAPFEGNTPTAILMKMLTTPPPAMAPDLGVPVAVETAIRTALAKNQDERFQHVGAFRKALKEGAKSVPMTRLLRAPSGSPPATREARALSSGLRPGESKSWVGPVAIGGVALLAAAGVGLFFALREPTNAVTATAPTQVDLAPIDHRDEAIEEPDETPTQTDAGNELGAPPTEFPEEPLEANPTMRPEPSQMRSRRGQATTMASAMESSMSTGPSAAVTNANPYAAEVRRLEASLEEVQRTVAAVAATRRGLRSLADNDKPSFCGRASGLVTGSEDGTVVSTVQQLRRIRGQACEPYEQSGPPDADLLRKLQRIPSTLDRAEEMAADRTISSNVPVDVADQVLAAVRETRTLLRGVEDGSRPFPCDAGVFTRLSRLQRQGNQWSGAAAQRVTRLRQDICRETGGLTSVQASELAERLSGQLDTAEGQIHAHETSVQRSLTAARLVAQ